MILNSGSRLARKCQKIPLTYLSMLENWEAEKLIVDPDQERISLQIEPFRLRALHNVPSKFHANRSTSLWVILLTDTTTKKWEYCILWRRQQAEIHNVNPHNRYNYISAYISNMPICIEHAAAASEKAISMHWSIGLYRGAIGLSLD